MSDNAVEPLETSEEYKRLTAKHADFKDQVHAILKARFPTVLRDQPRGRHNVDFLITEDFFGYKREWIVVTHSDGKLLPYDRAVRVVGSFKEDIERHDVHGVLVITDNGLERFAEDFLANNVGFLHRTLSSLQASSVEGDGFVQAGSILQIDRSSPDYQVAIDGLEQTSVTLQGDNQLSLPAAFKQRIVQELEAATALLKSSEVQAELVVNLILKTLKLIANKYAGLAVSAVAGGTIDAIIRLLDLHR